MVQLETIIEKLNLLFSINDFENAEKLIESTRKYSSLYNDTIAIFDATLAHNKNDYPRMWLAIKHGLEINPKNFELYVMLGEYYLHTNQNQAFLCFEQALLYCDNKTDYEQIENIIASIKQNYDITVNNVSFIILSYNTLDYTKTCITSIRENTLEASREIVIVDNASSDGSLEWLKKQNDIVLLSNCENTGFPKGCNQGIELSNKDNDILLLNNDTLLPANALFWLRMGLYENATIGTTGSITNFASNHQSLHFDNPTTESMLAFANKNNLPSKHPYEEKIYLVGFALLIKRSVYDKVGVLDERFSPGNYEDNDYGLRVLQAGYKNILCKNSFIIHFGSKSFGKKADAYSNLLSINNKKFEDKWDIPTTYLYPRMELLNAITEDDSAHFNMLVIGCKCGTLCAYLKSHFYNATICGTEPSKTAAKIAQSIVPTTCTFIEDYCFASNETYDYIIIEEDFENYKNPLTILEKLNAHLNANGQLIFIASNIKHYSVILPLILNDSFSYTNNNILNHNHVKLYTKTELLKLVQQAGYIPEAIQVIQLPPPTQEIDELIDSFVQMCPDEDKNSYLALQYVLTLKKQTNSITEKLNADEFLTRIDSILGTGKVDTAIELFLKATPYLESTTETQVFYILSEIYKAEKQNNIISFFHNRSTINKLIEVFDYIKFYVRRFDFDVYDHDLDFVNFIKKNNISAYALYFIILTSTIQPLDVAIQIEHVLLENGEYELSQTLKELFHAIK